jgi:hypothetical protein
MQTGFGALIYTTAPAALAGHQEHQRAVKHRYLHYFPDQDRAKIGREGKDAGWIHCGEFAFQSSQSRSFDANLANCANGKSTSYVESYG